VPNRSIRGIIAAMVTPFREDERIDSGACQVLIDTLIEAQGDGTFRGDASGEAGPQKGYLAKAQTANA
jgi:dihydrodipicolinate synthase/N-acetylneuraminate lyase